MMPDHREVLTLNAGCSPWSSRKGTVLFGMFHKEELVLMDDIHRKISLRERKQRGLINWPATGSTLWLEVGVPLVRGRSLH